MEADIKVYDCVDSTNTVLEELAENGAKEGTCVVAFSQKKGQGRMGRTFFSPEGGNLYLSILLRPNDPKVLEMITVAAAVSVVGAIQKCFGICCGIKWVNDIYLSERKVCGIIAQARNFQTDAMYIILGIGVNIYDHGEIPEDIRDIYGSVMQRPCDIPIEKARADALKLAEEIVSEFSDYYEENLNGCIDLYRKNCIVISRDVEYIYGDKCVTATVIDIDERGGLVVKTKDGIQTYRDGEIRIRLADNQT